MANSLLCFFLAVLEISYVLRAQEYVIERRSDSYDDINDILKIRPDRFTIPRLICVGDGSEQCSQLGGLKRENVNCSCACNVAKNNMFNRSTFGFYEKQWKCYENDKVRTHGDCSNILDGDLNRDKRSSLLTGPSNANYHVPNLTTRCSITMGKFLKCDGRWEQAEMNNWFVLSGRHYLDFTNPLPAKPNLLGRVIRLNITCSGLDRWPATTQCLLIKVKGTMTCTYPLSTSSLVMASTIGYSLQPSSTLSGSSKPAAKVSTSIKYQIQTPSTTSLTPLSPSSTLGLQHTRQTLNPSDRSTKQREFKPTLKSQTWKATAKGSGSTSTDNSKVVGGLLGGVVLLATLIIIIFIIKRIKRRKEDNQRNGRSDSSDTCNPRNPSIRLTSPTEHSFDDINPDVLGHKYDYAMAHSDNKVECEKCGNQAEIIGNSINFGYESMDGLNNVLPQEHQVCRSPLYDDVKLEQRQEPKQVFRPADGSAKSSVYESLEGHVPHVYGSLQVPNN